MTSAESTTLLWYVCNPVLPSSCNARANHGKALTRRMPSTVQDYSTRALERALLSLQKRPSITCRAQYSILTLGLFKEILGLF
jgi:hypothetical protein